MEAGEEGPGGWGGRVAGGYLARAKRVREGWLGEERSNEKRGHLIVKSYIRQRVAAHLSTSPL